jgi:hypothetical protein
MFVMKEKLHPETYKTTEKHNTSRFMGKLYETGNLTLEGRRALNKIFPLFKQKV